MSSPLWICPRCGRSFANRNQTHTCAPLGDLDAHFARSDPRVRECFDRVVGELGPLEILAEKSRIALHVRMSFAAFQPRRQWLDGHLVLARRVEHPLVTRIQEFSPHNIVHEFRLTRPDELDSAFLELLHEAYDVGLQRHHPPNVE
ncbi:DUF5655 domain-containing protein [Mycetocola sp. 2940]|uniref:DUF5655 domain-containing protein n=1 Tax=Mycetocola sp. 2940 TaxID=3156452 RepID=UPI00339602B3